MNWFVTAVGVLQIIAALWSLYQADWKMATINVGVGVANLVLSTMAR